MNLKIGDKLQNNWNPTVVTVLSIELDTNNIKLKYLSGITNIFPMEEIDNNWFKKESEMSDRAVPRITSVVPAQDQIDSLLKDRGSKYGSFDRHASLTCGLSDVFYAHMTQYNKVAYEKLTDSQREGLHMIFHKLGRIGNGDPNYADSWVDIAGYAKLVADELQKNEEFNKTGQLIDSTKVLRG